MKLLAAAGEPSGDAHGGPLLHGLRHQLPGLQVEGIGGPQMQEAGLQALFPLSALEIHGVVEVLGHLPRLLRVLRALEARMDAARPDAVLLIDYPGFNLRVAAAAKQRGIPVIFYSSPQVWAWRRGRLRTISRVVDKMIVLFPFEEALYREAGVDAAFVGHPLVGQEAAPEAVQALRGRLAPESEGPVVALMPGSRRSELERNLPQVLKGLRRMRAAGFRARYVLPLAVPEHRGAVERMIRAGGVPVQVEDEAFLPLLHLAELGIVASGTATLQMAMAGIPFVVVYRVAPLTYALARTLARVRHIAMVNILAGREMVPELLQHRFSPNRLRDTFLALARDRARQERMRRELLAVTSQLGPPGAYERAAELIAQVLRQPRHRIASGSG